MVFTLNWRAFLEECHLSNTAAGACGVNFDTTLSHPMYCYGYGNAMAYVPKSKVAHWISDKVTYYLAVHRLSAGQLKTKKIPMHTSLKWTFQKVEEYFVTSAQILLILFIVRHSFKLIITFPVCGWQDVGKLVENWNGTFRLDMVDIFLLIFQFLL